MIFSQKVHINHVLRFVSDFPIKYIFWVTDGIRTRNAQLHKLVHYRCATVTNLLNYTVFSGEQEAMGRQFSL